MRFAIQLASQTDVALTFLHVQHIMRMTTWNEATYLSYEQSEVARMNERLTDFVHSVCKFLTITPENYQCVVENSPLTDSTIMAYAADHGFDYICISARGAGMIEQMLGTTTANLIGQSSVPVIAVPGNYRTTKLSTVLYASDLRSLENKLNRVVDFAKSIGAAVERLHVNALFGPVTAPEIIGMAVRRYTDYPVTIHLKPHDSGTTFAADIASVVNARNPSLLVMFTTQRDGFFSRFFRSMCGDFCAATNREFTG